MMHLFFALLFPVQHHFTSNNSQHRSPSLDMQCDSLQAFVQLSMWYEICLLFYSARDKYSGVGSLELPQTLEPRNLDSTQTL